MPWWNAAGLRARGLMWMLSLSLVLGGAGLALLTWQLDRHQERAERRALAGDVRRVGLLLDDLVESRARASREWSHWSEMRAFALGQSPDFARENLSPASLRTSGLSALAVLDLDGTVLWAVSADARYRLAVPGHDDALGQWLRISGKGECGLVRWPTLGTPLHVLCRQAILDSGGGGEPAGAVLTWEALTPDQVARLARLGALHFELVAPAPRAAGGAMQDLGGTPVSWIAGDAQHRVSWPWPDVLGRPVAELVLDWPRQQQAEGRELLRRVQALWLITALLLVLALAWLVDSRVVRRLLRLRADMRGVRESARWRDRLRVSGSDEIAQLAQEGNHLLERIDGLVADLEQRALTDSLTGLNNRRAFDQAVLQALARRQRGGGPLVLALIDVDHFKRFNDTHGHAAGDDALRLLAKTLRAVARRAGDAVFRYGGEEFAWLIEGAEPEVATKLLEQLRQAVEALPVEPPLVAPLRISIGASAAVPGEGPATWFERADAALYEAKGAGRNRQAWR